MPRYRFQGPNGEKYYVDAPEGTPRENILAFAEANISTALPPVAAAAKPKSDINDTNFLSDTAASVISGVGQLLELPAQVYGLVSGDFKTTIGDMAHSVTQYGEDMKSPGLKARQEAAQERINKADKEGFFSGLGTGVTEYLSDPRLLASGVAETLPSLIGTAGAGSLAASGARKILGRELAEQAATRAAKVAAAAEAGTTLELGATAAERAVQRAATTGGVGFGAVQQGADVGTDAYVRAMQTPDEVWAKNPEFTGRVQAGEDPNQVKEDMALTVARESALAGGGISALTAGVLPGTFEKAVLGKKLAGEGLLSRTGKGFLGEATQEASEEGGGRLASNIAMQQINPEQNAFEGVGSQAGVAGILGGVSGAGGASMFGNAAEPNAPPAPEAPPASKVFGADSPVTAPPTEGLVSVLGSPGTDVVVDDNGTPTPYTFGGLSDAGHVILIDQDGRQFFTDPPSLEGIVSPAPVAETPPVESPPVGTPPAAPPIEATPVPSPPGEAPIAGSPPVEEPPVEMPPIGAAPAPTPPVGGTPPIDVTAVPPEAAPPAEVPPTAAPPAAAPPAAIPGEQIPPEAADDVFSQAEGELARTPNADLAKNLKGKTAIGAVSYLGNNAKSAYIRRIATQTGAMMRALQKQGFKFNFKMVAPNTNIPLGKNPEFFDSVQSLKNTPTTLGSVTSYPNPQRNGYNRNYIVLRDFNYPNANSGANEVTATHEFIHAATAALIYQYEDGRISKGSRVGIAIGELIELQREVKQYYNGVMNGSIPASEKTKEVAKLLENTNGFENEHEMLTYGLTDWRMQHLLKQIQVKNVNGFTAFVRAIGKMLGFTDKDTNALRKLIELSEEIIPNSPFKRARNAVLSTVGEGGTTLPSSEESKTLATAEEPGVAATGIGEEQTNLPKLDMGQRGLMGTYKRDVEMVPVSWLSELKGNDLRYTEEEMQNLMADIAQNGINNPLIVDVGRKNERVILGEGNHRLEAAKRLGYTHVPVRVHVTNLVGEDVPGSQRIDIVQPEERYSSVDTKPSKVFSTLADVALPIDTAEQVDSGLDVITNTSREDGDKIIANAAEPAKQNNEDRLDIQMNGEPVAKFSAKAMAKQGQVMPVISPSVDAVSNIGMLGSLTPASALARVNKYFRAMFDNMNDKLAFRNLLMARPEKLFADITRVSQESKDKLNQVMEYLRLSVTELKERPEQFSIKTEKIFRDGKYVAPALSKPGDTLKLNKEETQLLYRIRDYLNETYTLNAQSILQAVGYNGVYSLEGIQSLPSNTPKEASWRDSILRLYTAIESQRVTSYIPFMRSGDVRVIVKKTSTNDEGKQKTELAAFYMLDSNQWLREMVGPNLGRAVPDNALNKRMEEIRKQYPAKDGYTVVDTRLIGKIDDKLQLQDLGTLDKLVSLMNANSGKSIKAYFDNTMAGLIDTGELDEYSKTYAEQLAKGYISEWPDQIREVLMKQIAANFMKQSQNIPGYDTNLIDKLFDYNRIVATTISHRRYHPEYSKAKDAMVRNHAPGSSALRYALAWDRNADTPEHILWRGARAVGFYNAMWGSFSSSMVNAMSMWTVVAPQMYVMDSGAVKEVYKNSLKLVGAMSLDKTIGAYINVDKIRGLTPDEREALNWAYKTGTVRAQINPELMGMDAGLLTTKGGKIGKAMKRYFDIGSSVVSVTEEMNKVAAFLAAYKYANNPKAVANWKKAFANNERAKAIMEAGSDPRSIAAFMTETTTFIGGQIEKPPALRGFGGVALQFSQYPLQVAHLMYQNFAKMGPRGKQAGLFTLLTMFSVSGLLFAIPFGDDAINIFEWITEQITGKKSDFRLETQQMLVDLFGGGPEAQRDAEALLYGPFRSLLNLNIGERIGFTSMLPELSNPITAIPALSGTLGKIDEFKNRLPDQPIGAYTALLSPVMGKGVADVMRGLVVFPQEGYRTQFGSNIKSAEEIGAGTEFARALGLQSPDIARLVRAKRVGEDINTSTAGPERSNTRRLGKLLADAIRLERKGDVAGAERLREEFGSEVQDITERFQKDIEGGKLEDGVKLPSSESLREAVMFDLYPETRIRSYGKLKRAAILDARRDLLLTGEEDFPDLEDDEADQEDVPQFRDGGLVRGYRKGGLITSGNIDLHKRPMVKNPDGSISTVKSRSFGFDEGEVLLPLVSDNGRIMTDDEAVDQYRRTGRHLGIFSTPEAANAYAIKLHKEQEKEYVK